ncbi:hypothetical protein [Sphingomonas sp. VL_57B]|jgi:hypothetical protein|uniref:hypothetical protein n=1 Tax=Sphingomonas sp. VL_57B TaxID=3144220 RepID=UPI0031F5858A
MARKTKLVTIAAEGRDKGKCFLIREMPAMQSEKWAIRAILALGRADAEVEDAAVQGGAMAVLASLPMTVLMSLRRMNFEDAEPLLDEMMSCVAFVPDAAKTVPGTDQPFTRPLNTAGDDGDIEEVATLLTLRSEVIEVHVGFSPAAALSSLGSAAQRSASSPSPTPTSPESSEPLSDAA